eukprot:3904085-Alexandrium_andersonii.AAC.1
MSASLVGSEMCIRDSVWNPMRDSLMAGHWHALVVSPQCDTFSRAVWSNRCGPRPARDRENPCGYPWLTGALQR